MNSTGCPRKCWLGHVKSLKKELTLQNEVVELKLIKETLDKRECEEFEMDLQHKLKLHVYKELKRGVGFEDYLKNVKGLSSRLLFKFRSCTHGLLEKFGRHAKCTGWVSGMS